MLSGFLTLFAALCFMIFCCGVSPYDIFGCEGCSDKNIFDLFDCSDKEESPLTVSFAAA
jgi:hypothetical protein